MEGHEAQQEGQAKEGHSVFETKDFSFARGIKCQIEKGQEWSKLKFDWFTFGGQLQME